MVKGVAGLSMVGGSGQGRIGAKSGRGGGNHGRVQVANDVGVDECGQGVVVWLRFWESTGETSSRMGLRKVEFRVERTRPR